MTAAAPTTRPDHRCDGSGEERAGRRWPRDLARGLARGVAAHPLLVVLVVASGHALAAARTIWVTRTLGTYDPDELGYLATALRFHRDLDPQAPSALLDQVMGVTLGPLVPLLSVPVLVAGPREPRTAMLVQPLLLVIASVSAAGIARRVAGPWWAIAVGAYVASMPTMVLASQSYWYGLGAATFMAAATWALLASDRLSNRWSLVYGAALGLMLLTRTMALGFVPALAGAGLVLAWPDRRRLVNLVSAGAVTLLVAGPWWWTRRQEIFDYLFGYGFGPEAAEWGSGSPLDRVGQRIAQIVEAVALPPLVMLLALVAAGLGFGVAVRRHGVRGVWSETRRELLALGVIVVLGLVALASTTNEGVWFELPLVMVVVPLGAAAVARSPRPFQILLGAWMVVASVVVPFSMRAAGEGHADGAFAASDPSFAAGDPTLQGESAEQWWRLVGQVTDRLAILTNEGETGAVYMSGNTFLMNSNSLTLAGELRGGWEIGVRIPQTFQRTAFDADELTARLPEVGSDGRDKERVVVVVRSDLPLFTPDLEWEAYQAALIDAGFVADTTYPMPVGGEVAILRHRDAVQSSG